MSATAGSQSLTSRPIQPATICARALAASELSDPEQQIVAAFGIESVLLPLLPELLADIWILGSWPEKIVDLLRLAKWLRQGASVVDLDCGKGAVAIPIARDLSFSVHGIDLFPPFLAEARTRAESAGVSQLCHFEVGDLRQAFRAGELVARDPELAEALERYVESEQEECAFLESRTTAAIWLLERS